MSGKVKNCRACHRPLPPSYLVVDEENALVSNAGRVVEMGNSEFLLLRELSAVTGVTRSRDFLEKYLGIEENKNHLRVMVSRLRRKIGQGRIVAVGQGYQFQGSVTRANLMAVTR